MKTIMGSSMLAGLAIVTYFLSTASFATACTDSVYVGTQDGQLAISKDAGETWSTAMHSSWVYSIDVDGDHIYAGTGSGLSVSHDAGASWALKNLQNTSSRCVPAVKSVFVDANKRVYVLVDGSPHCARLAISSDNGDTWPINFPLPNPPFGDFEENIYVDGSRIYVASSSGLGYSDDTGATWTFKNQASGLGSYWVECVIGRGQTIYAGLQMDGAPVSMSTDGGLTSTTATTIPTGVKASVSSMYLQDDTLYVATYGGGLSWSSDFTTWTRKTTADGLADDITTAIISSGSNLYLGTLSGLSISRDRGQTWIIKTTADGLPSDAISAVFVQCV